MYPLATRWDVRLAELLGVLSLGSDLALGQPMEHALRQCLIALRLADRFSLRHEDRATIYYTALLINVGGPSDAYERARWFGDDIAALGSRYDQHDPRAMSSAAWVRRVGSGEPPLRRVKVGTRFVVSGRREVHHGIAQRLRIAQDIARKLRLPADVVLAIGAADERWDGRGSPQHLVALAVPTATRVVQLAEFAEVVARTSGVQAAVEQVRRRSGRQFDPRLCEAFCSFADEILDGLDGADAAATWRAVIEQQPTLAIFLSPTQFDAALHLIADLVDLKSPYTYGHSRAVAQLAGLAAERVGLPGDDVDQIYRAGLVHDLGRLGVSNSIWHKRGVLTVGERAEMRTYPGLTARILASAPSFRELGAIAGAHRERMDGSGYPLGLSGEQVPLTARVLAAADAYRSMREDRPHRVAFTREEARSRMRAEVRAGRLDPAASDAVLSAAADHSTGQLIGTSEFTTEELAVLRLLVRGMRPRDIARELMLGQRVTSQHVQQVYEKANASGRATVSLFAMSRNLVLE